MFGAIIVAGVLVAAVYYEEGRRAAFVAAVIAALVLGMAAQAQAQAATVPIDGPWWAQRAVDEMHAPVVPDQVLLLDACPGWSDRTAACNFPTPSSPIYIPREFYSREALARELGGRFDALVMTPAARWHFMAIMRYRGDWWSTDAMLTGNIEMFEDAYADCALGFRRQRSTLQRPARWIDWAGYRPRPAQHSRVCALIRRVGTRAGLRVPAASAS